MEDPIIAVNLTLTWYADGCVWALADGCDAYGLWPYQWKLGHSLKVYEALEQASQEWHEYNEARWDHEMGE